MTDFVGFVDFLSDLIVVAEFTVRAITSVRDRYHK